MSAFTSKEFCALLDTIEGDYVSAEMVECGHLVVVFYDGEILHYRNYCFGVLETLD